jgi:hypothetical protein
MKEGDLMEINEKLIEERLQDENLLRLSKKVHISQPALHYIKTGKRKLENMSFKNVKKLQNYINNN